MKAAVIVEELTAGRLVWLMAAHWPAARSSSEGFAYWALYRVSHGARWLAAGLTAVGIRVAVREAEYDYVDDVFTSDGTRAKDEQLFQAMPFVVQSIERDPVFTAAVHSGARRAAHMPYLSTYLSKRIFMGLSSIQHPELRSVIIAEWLARHCEGGARAVLYLSRDWWFDAIAAYAQRCGVTARPLPKWLIRGPTVPRAVKRWLHSVACRWVGWRHGPMQLVGRVPLRIAAEMYAQGITRAPLHNTEFFWYRRSTLPEGAVFGYFAHPKDQPTPARRAWLSQAGIGWLNRGAFLKLRETALAPAARVRFGRPNPRAARGRLSTVGRALQGYTADFFDAYGRWYRFFQATNTRIHVSAFDMFEYSEPLHAALADLGGISISLQRSIEPDPGLRRRTVTDVHFAFSHAQAQWERDSGSRVRQFITAGYIFDDAFPAARIEGKRLANALRARGARFIVCFFDQKLGIHPKWLGGARMARNDYRFLCDRMEQDPTLGLLLKPKEARSLPARLGPVWARVQALIDAGRCILLKSDSPDASVLPCVAASAADVAINWITGGTAALESYLVGTRTLLIRHGVSRGVFRDRLEGVVSFNTWEALWTAVERLRAHPDDPEIGNWEPVIDQYASFRDGQAAARIHQYIVWLYQALAAGRSKEEAMGEAAARYAEMWGSDCVQTVGDLQGTRFAELVA